MSETIAAWITSKPHKGDRGEVIVQVVTPDGINTRTDYYRCNPMAANGVLTCWGCHDGHSTERRAQLPVDIEQAFKGTIAGEK